MQLQRFCDNRYTKSAVNHLAYIRSDNASTEKNTKDEIQRKAVTQSNFAKTKVKVTFVCYEGELVNRS
jgi:hypothetical protein